VISQPEKHVNGFVHQAPLTARDALRLLDYASAAASLTRGQHLQVQAAVRVLGEAIRGAARDDENGQQSPAVEQRQPDRE
jgi:hypothetical protein